jgi:hypothetical protein
MVAAGCHRPCMGVIGRVPPHPALARSTESGWASSGASRHTDLCRGAGVPEQVGHPTRSIAEVIEARELEAPRTAEFRSTTAG